MTSENKMFQIGMCAFWGALILTVILQVCYRTQNRSLNHIRNDIVETQKLIAVKQARYEALIRSESLRNMIDMVNPSAETIGFQKYVFINDLKMKE